MNKHKYPQKSLVRVWFPERRISLSYFNDQFNLKVGDLVFVEGSLAGYRGQVVEVAHTFKIKKSEYKKVIAVANTEISGEVFFAGKSIIALDEKVLPYEKVRSWFFPPVSEEEEEYEIVVGKEEEISLDTLEKMKIDPTIRSRGEDYFEDDRVAYIEIEDDELRAIVQGSKNYEVTCKILDGKVTELLCNCPYPGTCKHEYATLLFLKEVKKVMDEEYGDDFDFDYLAMMPKSTFLEHTVWNQKKGSIKFD